jgi:hypothetical protein
MCRYDDPPETIATTSGRAIPDTEVRCVDREGREVPRGEPGEVVVRGYNVMQGYFEDEEETRKTIDAGGWLHTGDVAVMDERGYLRITDRIKDMFITGGFNCYPAEIESLLYAHGGIAQAAVIGIPDERLGEVGKAFVVPAPGAQLTPAAVIAWCRDQMANYKVPRAVEIVDALPLNASGKVMKYLPRACRARRPDPRPGLPGRRRGSGLNGSPFLFRGSCQKSFLPSRNAPSCRPAALYFASAHPPPSADRVRYRSRSGLARGPSGVDDRVDEFEELAAAEEEATASGRRSGRPPARGRGRGAARRARRRVCARTSGRRRSRSTGSRSFESAWLWRRSPARLGSTVPSGVELKRSK